MARLLSVNVGLPRDSPGKAGPSIPGSGRRPSRVRARCGGSTSTATARAIPLVTAASSAPCSFIRIEFLSLLAKASRPLDLVPGQFGENFTVDGLADTEVCIGDRYKIGSALFEVTQPRVTCYRLGIRMEEPDMAALLVKHGRPGFYFRVIEEGDVEAGDEIIQVASGPESMSVSEINALLYLPPHPRERLERALQIPALSRGWRRSFAALLEQHSTESAATGNAGLGPAASPPPAWRGFRPFRVSRKIAETNDVTSLILEPADGHPEPSPCPASSSSSGSGLPPRLR